MHCKACDELRARVASLEADKCDLAKLLDNERARVAELEREREDSQLDLAAREAECVELRAALYPLVVGCLAADAREDAPEFVNGEAEAGRRALPECVRCCGSGSTDGTEYVDVEIPEALRCPDCGGWGFLSRPPGSDAALRAMLMQLSGMAWADLAPSREVDVRLAEAWVARLLPPATQAQGEKEGAEG